MSVAKIENLKYQYNCSTVNLIDILQLNSLYDSLKIISSILFLTSYCKCNFFIYCIPHFF